MALVGGWAFHLLHLPLAWMLGAMCATMLAALLELPVVARTRPMRPPFAAILGVTLGATFRPSALPQGQSLAVLLIAITVSTLLCGFAGYQYLRRIAKFDPITAYFAAMPAGLQEMALQGGQAGGDERRIALIHACRVSLLVLVVPLTYGLIYHIDSQKTPLMTRTASDIASGDWLWLAALIVVGWGVARKLDMPNAPMIGPLLLSASVHLLGWTEASPPHILIVIAQVVIGSALGSNFVETRWAVLWQSLRHGLVLVPILCGVCLSVAIVAASLVGQSFGVVFLTLAPGGTTEMSLIALALHADVALVVSSQLIRILLVNLGATSLFRLRQTRRGSS
ncbi:membrane protein [Paracoccus kondratievae]|uniref:Membrane protein n=1 Tax=Paracoccus kondratievae TaxID=135740 RepID=A0AAD3NXS2_9RHOB|nr:membrane protein [Paracoccus kondratievae]